MTILAAEDPTADRIAQKIVEVSVVVPAHDEVERIGRALHALAEARDALLAHDSTVDCSFIVVADACSDGTAAEARRLCTSQRDVVLETNHRNVGKVRRAGVAHAVAATVHDPGSIWLASTDADSAVDSRWLVHQVELAAAGVDAVAGVVELYPDADADHLVIGRFADSYRVRCDGSHDHVHGANLGVRASAYRGCGGWRPLEVGEDQDLWDRLVAGGWHLSQRADLVVQTSARRNGRAPRGFAADLVTLEDRAGKRSRR